MFPNERNEIIREHFDISDATTRKTIVALDEAEQGQLLSALSNALYDKIIEKVDKIDFGTIPQSRGDITKVEGFENTVECLNIMRKLVMEYKENPEIVDTVLAAIENIKTRKATFMKAYALNIEMPMVMYNMVVMAIEQSVSFLITVCIQYIKDPASQSMNAALDKVAYSNTKDNLLFEQLSTFNSACANKDMDYVLEEIMKGGARVHEGVCASSDINDAGAGVNTIVINVGKAIGSGNAVKPDECPAPTSSPFQKFEDEEQPKDNPEQQQVVMGATDCTEQPVEESLVGAAAAVFGATHPVTAAAAGIVIGAGALAFSMKAIKIILKCVIPMLRAITYYFYNTKASVSEYLSIQAQFLEANAYKLQFSTAPTDDAKMQKTVKKQLKLAEKLKSLANKLAIDNKVKEKQARTMAMEDKKKKIADFDNLPADIAAKSVLF